MLSEAQWQELLDGFLEESGELVERCEQSLAQLEQDPESAEAINELFRAVHTIKGSAGLLGLDLIVAFVHDFETVLMAARDGEIVVDQALVALGLRCADHLTAVIETVACGRNEDPDPQRADKLKQALLSRLATEASEVEAAVVPVAAGDAAVPDIWHISLRFPGDLFRNGFDPASFVRYLGQLGTVVDVVVIRELLPERLDQFDPEHCYLGLEIRLQTAAEKVDIENAFEFIWDAAEIKILPPQSKTEDYLELLNSLSDGQKRVGELLVEIGAITPRELEQGLGLQASSISDRKIGEVLIEQAAATPDVVREALDRQHSKRVQKSAFIRVSAEKLDALINQVGELVVSAAGAQMRVGQRQDSELNEMFDDIHQHVELIRESALQLRMVEIGEIFNRFHRVVRETSDSLAKQIRLDIRGADTELDKSLVDRLYDPLVHMVRNAIDHGIESPEDRLAAGKPAEGRIVLNAYHESGMIAIEIEDDGRGINVEKVRQKAIENGVIEPDAILDEKALVNLIFHPGLSTAKQVSNLSGRGVGMDSVRQDIENLRGTVDIDNVPGQGCRMKIRLPLTLAIIDGFLVSVSGQFFVIPSDWVTECVEAPGDIDPERRDGYVELREQALPYVSLRSHFSLPNTSVNRRSLVVVAYGQDRAGFLVDELHGEIQTVIKPLGPLFDHLPDVAGGTILGSGHVALTLDVHGLLTSVRERGHAYIQSGDSETIRS